MAKYKGRTVKLNKIQRGDVKKFKVFVRDKSSGRVKKVNFGSKTMIFSDKLLIYILYLAVGFILILTILYTLDLQLLWERFLVIENIINTYFMDMNK